MFTSTNGRKPIENGRRRRDWNVAELLKRASFRQKIVFTRAWWAYDSFMKKFIVRALIVLAVVIVLGVVAISLFLDGAIKKGVETFGPQLTKVSIKLDSVSLSILSGSGGIKGLVVGNPEGFKTPNAVSVGHASLGISPMSLLSDKIVIKHIRVEEPVITFEGGLSENNLSKIVDNLNAASGPAQKPAEGQQAAGAGKKLQVNEFLIKGAKVNVSLSGMGGKVIPMPLPDIRLADLGTGPEGITAAELSKLVMKEILNAASTTAASDAVKNVAKEATAAVKDASKQATDAVKDVGTKTKDALKGVGDIFKK
jgi:uncharacterized protein involved in outer membrane biogenesis